MHNKSIIFLLVTLLSVSSCLFKKRRKNKDISDGSQTVRDFSNVSAGNGRVLEYNPIIISGNENLSIAVDFATLLRQEQDFITSGPTLESAHFKVLKKESAAFLAPNNGGWGFDPNSDEFWEVHTFYHINKAATFFNVATENSWTGNFLTAYSTCKFWNNASFSSTDFSICLGVDPDDHRFKMAQDPSVIYHELGHAFIKIMINLNNANSFYKSNLGMSHYKVYDEGGAIGEGISDYFSYVINGRSRLGEWGMGRFYDSARPVRENDSLHKLDLSEQQGGRLSYPTYISYDVNNPSVAIEEVHNAGQITSHVLVALTENLKTSCQYNHQQATKFIINNLKNTLSELGDLGDQELNREMTYLWIHQVKPINYYTFYQTFANNLRKLSEQITCYDTDDFEIILDNYGLLLFNKYHTATASTEIQDLRYTATMPGEKGNDISVTYITGGTNNQATITVTGTNIEVKIGAETTRNDIKDAIEQSVARGLVNVSTTTTDNRVQIAQTAINLSGGKSIPVAPENRVRSSTSLASKNDIIFADGLNATKAYIFEDAKQIQSLIDSSRFMGNEINISDKISTNNTLPNNVLDNKITRGEVVGLSLNLKNKSGVPMTGVQILANSWDHGTMDGENDDQHLKPCNINNDGSLSAPTTGGGSGDCARITKVNGNDIEPLMPACLIRLGQKNSTQWVGQNEYRKSIGKSTNDCLHQNGHFNNCLINILPGADSAIYSKIDAGKTWGTTFSNGTQTAQFTFAQLILLEVNPDVTPGLKVKCRFRVRFTNCSDCYRENNVDGNDYSDYQYSGPKPYKLIEYEFEVN